MPPTSPAAVGSPAKTQSSRLKNLDFFVLANLGLFLLMCVFSYYDRFVQYRGPANLVEFLIYALAIILGSLFLWFYFRKYSFDSRLLACIQIGILMHYAGAFVQVGGSRLYDTYLFGLRYDKYVHFTNAFIIALLVGRLFQMRRMKPDLVNAILIMVTVLGLGAIIEIVEYLVCLTVPSNGVGGYDNNMQDLIANLIGGLTSVLLQQRRKHPRPA